MLKYNHRNRLYIDSEIREKLAKLQHDEDLRLVCDELLSKSNVIAESFSYLMEVDGRSVIRTEEMLLLEQDIEKVDIQNYKFILNKFKTRLLSVRDKVCVLQGMVHHAVETSRSKKQRFQQNVFRKEGKMKDIDSRINNAEEAISEYETSACNYDRRARELERSSEKSVDKSIAHVGAGIAGGVLGVGIGFALAPFTGKVVFLHLNC